MALDFGHKTADSSDSEADFQNSNSKIGRFHGPSDSDESAVQAGRWSGPVPAE